MQLLALMFALLSSILVGSSSNEPDWPQWKGPDRTGLSKETGLLKEWPEGGPPLVWSIKGLGEGYGTVAIKGPNASGVALNKMTGKTAWTSRDLSDPAAYSSCILADVQGVLTLITLTSAAGVGVRATDGKLMWRYEPVANRTANVTTPIFYDNKVFYTTAYGTGCALLGLTANNNEVQAQEIYFSLEMQDHHGGVALVDGYIYGFSNAILTCMEFGTGKSVWKHRSVGKGSLTCADGKLYLLGENNVVGLADASPEGYRERGRFGIEDQGRPSWAHPVVCGGRLYIRNQSSLSCHDIKIR